MNDVKAQPRPLAALYASMSNDMLNRALARHPNAAAGMDRLARDAGLVQQIGDAMTREEKREEWMSFGEPEDAERFDGLS